MPQPQRSLLRLSGLDAGFLALETRRAPMHVGGVSLLDPRHAAGSLSIADLRHRIRERLGAARALRRRLAAVPLQLRRPYWVELSPEQVDLEAHVERTELPAPGGWHELSELMAFELGQPLDRSRPLWRITWVDGLHLPDYPAGTIALVSVVHHAAIDGVSGAEILSALYDGAGPPRSDTAAVTSDEQEPPDDPPGVLALLARAGRDLAREVPRTPAIVGRSLLGLGTAAWGRLRGDDASPLPYTAPASALNRPLGPRKVWAPARLDLERIRAIKNAADATVNDVVLAVCAGALRDHLLRRAELPADPLVAMVPISVRGDGERGDAGNLVSALLVSLATDEPDAHRRLQRIRDAARSAKASHQAVGARTLLESADLLPFGLSGLAVRLYSRLQLADHHRPIFNLVITNVPGPRQPLTLGGARLLAHFGAAPLFDGLGLILPIMSYAGQLTVGVTADHAVLPDAAGFARRLEAALDELAAAVTRQAPKGRPS